LLLLLFVVRDLNDPMAVLAKGWLRNDGVVFRFVGILLERIDHNSGGMYVQHGLCPADLSIQLAPGLAGWKPGASCCTSGLTVSGGGYATAAVLCLDAAIVLAVWLDARLSCVSWRASFTSGC
jgi:hypothetical protein